MPRSNRRSVPSVEAVELLDGFLTELRTRGVPVLLISGNHDSPERLAFGGRVMDSCGIHIHVDASRHDPKTLRNIVNIMASKEDLLYKALRVQIDREYYCQKADLRFLEDVNLKRPKHNEKTGGASQAHPYRRKQYA